MSEQKKETLTIRISEDLKLKYQSFCDSKGYSLSKRIRKFINDELKKNE